MTKIDTKKSLKPLLIIIIILAIVLLAIVFILKSSSLNKESKIVTDIYKYVGNNDLEVCSGLVNYQDKEVNYDTLENTDRLCLAYTLINESAITTLRIEEDKNNICKLENNLTFATDNNNESDTCTINRIDASLINQEYKKAYGKDITDYDEFLYDYKTVCKYAKEDDNSYYYCGNAQEFTIAVGATPKTYRAIKDVYQNKDSIIIYDYFLKVIDDECYEAFTTNTKNDNCTNEYNNKTFNDSKKGYKFLKKYGTLYKHTFLKENAEYYWVKSEVVK